MIELEKTYLAKYIPKGLKGCKSREIIDIYIPKSSRHPVLRIRKKGDNYEITKKEPVKDDASHQKEDTIKLTAEEFGSLSLLDGKRIHKKRYYYDYKGRTAEVDVFQGPLKGLVLVDVEFSNKEDKDAFEMPDFCLVEITHEEFAAGGMLCGKGYEEIKAELEKFGYKKLFMD